MFTITRNLLEYIGLVSPIIILSGDTETNPSPKQSLSRTYLLLELK